MVLLQWQYHLIDWIFGFAGFEVATSTVKHRVSWMTSYPADRCLKWVLEVVVAVVVVVVSWMYNSLYLYTPTMNFVHYNIEQKYFASCLSNWNFHIFIFSHFYLLLLTEIRRSCSLKTRWWRLQRLVIFAMFWMTLARTFRYIGAKMSVQLPTKNRIASLIFSFFFLLSFFLSCFTFFFPSIARLFKDIFRQLHLLKLHMSNCEFYLSLSFTHPPSLYPPLLMILLLKMGALGELGSGGGESPECERFSLQTASYFSPGVIKAGGRGERGCVVGRRRQS